MILVIGGTGMLGGRIVRRLVGRGEKVRALIRDSSGKKGLSEIGAETAWGDLKDPASLRDACDGISTVITTANSVARGGDDNVETVDLEGNRSLVEAALSSGVEHFIFISVQGEDPDSPNPFIRAKGLTSKQLRESGMAYTRNDAAVDRDFLIGGPEPVSWRDVIAIYEGVKGVSLEIQSLQPGESMPGFPDGASGFMAMLESYDSPEPISNTEAQSIFGVRQTTVEDFLRQQG
ncbi:MAG: NmrA family NAD(P)-binding protein [Actinobacteria bacterium]|nr:NmrA family NAD(P)-binding protein [Actinomycetota bacterium]